MDGALVTTWTSSGTTDGFESIDLTGSAGEVIEVTGVLDALEWLSIIEVSPALPSEAQRSFLPGNGRVLCWGGT